MNRHYRHHIVILKPSPGGAYDGNDGNDGFFSLLLGEQRKDRKRGRDAKKREEVGQQYRHYRHCGCNYLKKFNLSHDGFCDDGDGDDGTRRMNRQ